MRVPLRKPRLQREAIAAAPARPGAAPGQIGPAPLRGTRGCAPAPAQRLARLAGCAVAAAGLWLAAVPATAALPPASVVVDADEPALDTAPWPPPVAAPTAAGGCTQPLQGTRRTYHVGPGQPISDPADVPWLALGPGDVVNLHHRPEPYRVKLGLRARGTAAEPVVIHGVTDAQCNRPELSGAGAVTARDLAAARFFSKEYSEFLGVILIFKAPGDPWTHRPRHITIQNLKITGANKANTYTAQDGTPGRYAAGAAAIYAVRVSHLTVQDNEITGNGNGVFVNSRDHDDYSRNIVVRRNRLHGNGNPGSYLEHNLYVQAARVLYEGNTIGQLVPGAAGSSLKDRSSGTVVRYNRIAAAARALDLVEIEGGVGPVYRDPLYHDAWVYGNLIVSDHDLPARSSTLLIHWGGDNDPRWFRTGTLHFYNNTVVTRASRAQAWYLAVFDLPGREQKVDARANVFWHRGSSRLYLAYKSGTVRVGGTNWLSRGWDRAWSEEADVVAGGDLRAGASPELDEAFMPTPRSPLLAVPVHRVAEVVPPGRVDALQVDHQYAPAGGVAPRRPDTLGAFARP